jgi:t-SNARE complex subunit (syntaxin)
MAHNPNALVEYHPLRQTTSVERTGEQLSDAILQGNRANIDVLQQQFDDLLRDIQDSIDSGEYVMSADVFKQWSDKLDEARKKVTDAKDKHLQGQPNFGGKRRTQRKKSRRRSKRLR